MKILLLGATGRTGRHLLQQALDRGHQVHVLVRNTAKITLKDSKLTVFEGNPADLAALSPAMNGCDAILSALNISRVTDWPWSSLRTPKDFLSTVMKNIIVLASKYGIKRIIFISAWGAAETRKDIPGWFRWFIEHSNIRYPYEEHAVQEALISETNLDWTSVRAAGLTNFKRKKEVVVSLNNTPKPHLTISRNNLASFMLDILENNSYIKQLPVVSEK